MTNYYLKYGKIKIKKPFLFGISWTKKKSKIKISKHGKNWFFDIQKSNEIYSGKIFDSKKNHKIFDLKSFREENQGGGKSGTLFFV